MAEGTIFFANEPVLRVTAPLPQAQLVETRLINIVQFQTMIASKAVRMTRLMPDRQLVDYGLRRSHGSEAGLLAARAAYVAGFVGTATVLAGKEFGIPIYGTMAHSFIQAHDSEEEAFAHFAASHPNNCVLLLDTYDTERAANKVVAMAPELARRQISIRGVRLDSGDIIELSRKVRRILDAGGLRDVLIFASGDMDEYTLERFRASGAPVDGYGIGSKMTTSTDHPYFNCAYKLVEYRGRGRRKLAEHKTTWPGSKQVYRHLDGDTMCGDTLALATESHAGTPLIHPFMKDGSRLAPPHSLLETRTSLQRQLAQLPPVIDRVEYNYPVRASNALRRYADEVTRQVRQHEESGAYPE